MSNDWKLLETRKEISALESRCQLLDVFRSGAIKTTQELSSLYERRLKACQEETSKALADVAKAETDASALRQHNEQLRLMVAALEVRLDVAIHGKQNEDECRQEDQNDMAIESVLKNKENHNSASRLTKLMLAYEQGRDKDKYDSVYDELFQLREEQVKLIAQNANMRAANEQLHSLHNDTKRRLERAHDQCDYMKEQLESSKQHSHDLEKTHQEQKEQIQHLNDELHAMKKQKQDLQNALQATGFQLRELLQTVHIEKHLLPPSIQSSADLYSYANTVTDTDPDLLVFKDIDELQQKNQQLIVELQQLTGALRDKTTELNAFKSQSSNEYQQQQQKLEEAYRVIADLKTINSVHKIQRSVTNGVSNESAKPLDDIFTHVKIGRELKQLEDALEDAQKEASDMRLQLLRAKEEIKHYQQQAESYKNISDTRLAELSRRQAVEAGLQQRLNDAGKWLDQRKDEITRLNRAKTLAEDDSINVRKKLEYYVKIYNDTAREKEVYIHQIDELTQSMRDQVSLREQKLTEATEFIKHLKSQIDDHQQVINDTQKELASTKQQLREQRIRSGDDQQQQQQQERMDRWNPMEEVKRLERENIRLAKELAEINEQHVILEVKMANYEQERDPERLAQFEKDAANLTEARANIESLKQQLKQYEEELKISNDENAKISQERSAFVDDMTAMLNAQQQQLDDYRSREKAMETSANEIQRIKDEKVEAENAWQRQKESLTEEINGMRTKLMAQEDRAKQLQQEMDAQVNVVKETQQQLERVKSELEEKEKAQADSNATSTQETEQLTKELNDIKQQLATSQSQASSAEKMLAEQKAQWENTMSGLRAELAEATSQMVELKSKMAGVDMSEKESLSTAIISETFSDDNVKQLAINLQRQYKELQVQHKGIEEQRSQLQQNLENTQQELERLKIQLEELQLESEEKRKQQDMTLKSMMSKASAYMDNNERLRGVLCELENECKTLKEKLSQKEMPTTTTEQQPEQENQEAPASSSSPPPPPAAPTNTAELEEMKKKVEEMEKEKDALREELNKNAINMKKFQAAAAGFKKRWETSQEQLKEIQSKQQGEDNQQKIKSLEGALDAVKKEKEALEAVKKEKEQEKEQVEGKFESLKQQAAKLQVNYNNLLKRSRGLLTDKAAIEKELQELKQKLNEPSSPAGVKRTLDNENQEESKSPKTPKTQ